MSDRPVGDQQLFSEQVVQTLVEDIRSALENQLTPEQVSQAFQTTSDKLAERITPPRKRLPDSVVQQLSVLLIALRLS